MGKTLTAFSETDFAPTVRVSGDAERFARAHGLWDSLADIEALILRSDPRVVLAVDVGLVSDPEIGDRFVIGFNIRTDKAVTDVLAFDEALQQATYDKVPTEHQARFAVRFDFV
jgi:hypothetical protein